jgi:signal transduction histidine kinase
MISRLKDFLKRVLGIGVTDSIPPGEERYIRFTNIEALFTLAGVAIYVFYSLCVGQYLLGLVQAANMMLALIVFWLNYKQHYKTARMVFLFTLNSIILFDASYIGPKSGIQDFFYISYTIPFLLFNVRDYKYIITGVLCAVFAYNAFPYVHPSFAAYNFDVATQLQISRMNSYVIFTLFGGAVYVLTYYNFKTEAKLEESNRKLEEQALELKRSNEDLEQFAYIISHDLKAPVRNISGFMGLLKRQLGEASDNTKELVDMSKQSAERLGKQIDDMLSYCKLDRNLPPVGVVDLNQMVRTIKMEMGEKVTEKNAEIIVERELPVLDDVHSSMLHHVFQNLIANGIKFNTGKPEVRINYTELNGIFTFRVSDNGIGIPMEYKSKLFQMFKRLHTVNQFEGTGIGLAVCKKIVDYYHGEIWFESEPEKGTTFFFTLDKPLAEIKPEQASEGYNTIRPVLSAA